MADYAELVARIRRFGVDRDWTKFHDPKSLLIALMGEVGEVAELVQWLPADQVTDLIGQEPLHSRVAEELADVFIYLVQLADACRVDLLTAGADKLTRAEARYAPDDVKGVAPDRFESATE